MKAFARRQLPRAIGANCPPAAKPNPSAIGCGRKAGLYTSGFPSKASEPPWPMQARLARRSRSSWAAVRTGRRCRRPPPCSTSSASATRRRWSPPTARPSACTLSPRSAKANGFKVIIAAAGGAAHLPGMTASMTILPVLGVPIRTRALDGIDSLLSIQQMPAGIPVGALAIGEAGARNAGLLGRPDPRPERRGPGRPARGVPRPPDRVRGGIRERTDRPCPRFRFRPDRPSACWAAGSLAACWRWRPRDWASARWC